MPPVPVWMNSLTGKAFGFVLTPKVEGSSPFLSTKNFSKKFSKTS